MFVITIEGCHQEHYSRFCIKTVEHSRHLAPPGGVSGPARSSSPTSSCAPSVCATPAIDRSHPNVKVELANGEGKIFFSNPGHKDLNLELVFRNVFFIFSVLHRSRNMQLTTRLVKNQKGNYNIWAVQCSRSSLMWFDISVFYGGLFIPFQDLFIPELPRDKQDAMEKLNFGTVDKIFLEYDRPFLAPILTEGKKTSASIRFWRFYRLAFRLL